MFPAPISPIRTVGTLGPPAGGLALVEEALLHELGSLLGRDLDVARREQEHLVGDPLHAAVERVREPAREVDEALGEVGIGALEVEDHRDRVLELVGDLLGVVEVLRHHEVHAHLVAGAAVADRAQDARLCRVAGRVVGEDVVDLVTTAAADAAHLLAGPVALLELRLGLEVPALLVDVLIVLDEAEVLEGAVPGVAKGHGQISNLGCCSCRVVRSTRKKSFSFRLLFNHPVSDRARSPAGRSSLPLPRRPRSPGWCPSTGSKSRGAATSTLAAALPVRGAPRSVAAHPRAGAPAAASSSARQTGPAGARRRIRGRHRPRLALPPPWTALRRRSPPGAPAPGRRHAARSAASPSRSRSSGSASRVAARAWSCGSAGGR